MATSQPPNASDSAGRSGNGSPATRAVLDDTAIRRALMRISHEIVERNEAAVRKRYSRALEELRHSLADMGGEGEA